MQHMIEPIEKHALLIVFVGVDGSGKTTQARRLAASLREEGHSATFHPHETYTPLREIIDHVAVKAGYEDGLTMMGRSTVRLFSSLLKYKTLLGATEILGDPKQIVIMDRYSYCQYAVSRHWKTDNEWLLRLIFERFPTPDFVFYMAVDVERAQNRIMKRGSDHETIEFLHGVDASYRTLPEFQNFIEVDANQAPDVIQKTLTEMLAQRIAQIK